MKCPVFKHGKFVRWFIQDEENVLDLEEEEWLFLPEERHMEDRWWYRYKNDDPEGEKGISFSKGNSQIRMDCFDAIDCPEEIKMLVLLVDL